MSRRRLRRLVTSGAPLAGIIDLGLLKSGLTEARYGHSFKPGREGRRQQL